MGRYRKIDTRVWGDEKIAKLSSEGKLFFLYLLTSSHSTAWGAYVLPDLYVQADLGFTPAQLKRCWAEVVSEQLANRDEPTKLVCFPNWFRYNPPENQKTAAACINGILSMPRSETLAQFCRRSEWVSEQLAKRNLTPPERLEGEQRALSTEQRALSTNTSAEQTGADPMGSLATPKEPKEPIPINGKPRATKRVPDEFDLTPPRLQFATAHGLTVKEAELQFDTMCDTEFRIAHSDWEGVWRNWVRRHVTDRPKQLQRR